VKALLASEIAGILARLPPDADAAARDRWACAAGGAERRIRTNGLCL
jgi:hypothetical protein